MVEGVSGSAEVEPDVPAACLGRLGVWGVREFRGFKGVRGG